MTKLYFAYGANMDIETMLDRCPSSKFLIDGSLVGYRFIINKNGVATIVKDNNHAVFGKIWELAPEDEDFLDLFEGVKGGWYFKNMVVVDELSCEKKANECLVYISSNSTIGSPIQDYFENIIDNCKKSNFPSPYLKYLESLRQRLS
jgi:gamma-glutamylcyclotransferase (GGCT)/AIG2-like uncharacterized protein YtfP